jgi:nucleoside-diphosphate-sugar epimerase
MNIFVTGGTGFVGKALLAKLAESAGTRLSATVRRPAAILPAGVTAVPIEGFDRSVDCESELRSMDVVVHLAARVHVMRETEIDGAAAFRRVNVDGTLTLARQAAKAGVRRFIYLSSIKVNGEGTAINRPYTAEQAAQPLDEYGRSKWEAELGLRQVAADTAMEVVIIRPPLVYGPGVGANFRAMMQWLRRGLVLPLGAVTQNRRSLVSVRNLADLIATCTHHPGAAGETFLVSDGDDLSTADLLRRLGAALGKPARLLAVPVPVLRLAARVAGRSDIANRLLGSLQVDAASTRRQLDWQPPFGVDHEFRATALAFLSTPQ